MQLLSPSQHCCALLCFPWPSLLLEETTFSPAPIVQDSNNSNNNATKQTQVNYSRSKISCRKHWWSILLWVVSSNFPVSLVLAFLWEETGQKEPAAFPGCEKSLPLKQAEKVPCWTMVPRLGVELQKYHGQQNFKLMYCHEACFF